MGITDLLSSIRTAVANANSGDDEMEEVPRKQKKKMNSKTYYKSFSFGSDYEGPSDKQRKSQVQAGKKDLYIRESGLPLCLNVAESEQIASSSIVNR